MRATNVLLAVVLGIAFLGGIAWWAAPGGSATEPTTNETATEDAPIPEISPTGPYPKAVVDSTEYNFGVMEAGATGTHVFVVRNEGEAPLQLVARKEDSTCTCTVGRLQNKQLAPGESTEVELKWRVKEGEPLFENSAMVRTNDPENPSIRFVIRGRVGHRLTVSPGRVWDVGALKDEGPNTVSAFIYSETREAFQLTAEPADPDVVKVELTPLTERFLKDLHAKSGYEAKTTVSTNIPMGPYKSTVTLHTDLEGAEDLVATVRAYRRGPVTIRGAANWYPKYHLLEMGTFEAASGHKEKLAVYVKGGPDEFRFTHVETDPAFLTVHLEPGPSAGEDMRIYFLTIEVPPGSPPVPRNQQNPARIMLKTNHPEVPEILIRALFVSI